MVNRRTLLKLLAAGAVAGCSRDPGANAKQQIVVAGAGIVGASVAFHLARSGADVTVIDQQAPASHASRGTFAWINATWAKQPKHYHEISQASVAYWRELANTLQLPVRWGGSLEWFIDEQRTTKLVEQIDEQIAWGEPAQMIDTAEFSRIEPNVEFIGGTYAALSGNDGAVDPVLATQKLLAAAERLGAEVLYPCRLLDIQMTGERLVSVETSTGPIMADKLVLATGAAPGITQSIAGIDIPQRSRPGVIVVTEPLPRILQHIIAAPGIHLHQRNDGRVVIGEQDGAPQNEAHALRLDGRPNNFPADAIAGEHAQRMLAAAARFVPEIAAAKVADVFIGWRPLPLDGHPVLGASPARPDVYIAIMHSGVTLAPVAGRFAALELTSESAIAALDPFRPDREFELVKRY
jgi:glycine/D-amino acid oxidase-like deaminating enzyme